MRVASIRYATKTGALAQANTAALVVSRAAAGEVAAALGVEEPLRRVLAGTKAKAGAVARMFLDGRPSVLLVVGREAARPRAGKRDPEADFRKDMAAAASALLALDVADATLALDGFAVPARDVYWKTRTALAAVSAASYRFTAFKSKRPQAPKLRRVAAHAADRAAAQRAVRHAQAVGAGLAFAKDLANQPPNVCDPAFVASQAQALAGDAPEKINVEVVEEERMAELGMGAFLSVSQGSDKPAKMAVASYRGAAAGARPVVLIGKGITFDTGGINLKTGASIGEMKFDMCGAAAVLGVLKAAAAAELPLNVVAIAAAAENMPSGGATRPGDIVTTMSGKTVEILNTDAEGRLVLCDALTYAERFKPRAVIDVATLTGAQVTALGSHASALYANDDALADALADAGVEAHDRFWRMPLWDDYQAALKSEFADMKNIGGRAAGSITAACFLARFVGDYPWAHLDIAGAAYVNGKKATGRPVSALFQYLLDLAADGAPVETATRRPPRAPRRTAAAGRSRHPQRPDLDVAAAARRR